MATSMSHSRSNNFKENTKNNPAESSQNENQMHFFAKPLIKCQMAASAMKQFYANSKITLKNLNIGHGELCRTLTGNSIKVCDFNEESHQAIIELGDCENAIDIMGYLVKSYDIAVVPSRKLLCIAQLPSFYDDKDLRELVLEFGEPTKCFMYRCIETDESLGYGFVEFNCSIEKSKQIQESLDWLELENCLLHCEFSELTFYDKLCSKCLMIDNLPKDFTDVMALRDIFSCCHKPLYCQIVMNDGESLGFGVIEYHTHEEAQKSKRELDSHVINGEPIRLSFCMPGKPGFCVCSRIQTKFKSDKNKNVTETMKGGLLPDPVFLQDELMNTPLAKKLCEQYPDLVTCFKQSLNQFKQTYTGQMTGSSKPGLLGPAPSVQMNPLLNPNMQLGLLVLLALQLQSKSHNRVLSPLDLFGLVLNQQSFQAASILGDPLAVQASIILKNLTSQLSSNASRPIGQNRRPNNQQNSSLLQTLTANVKDINVNMLINLGQLASSIQNSSGKGLLGCGPQPLMKGTNINQKPKSLLELPIGGPKSFNKSTNANQKPKSLLELDLSEYERKLHSGQGRMNNSAIKENIPTNRMPPQPSPSFTVPPSVNGNMHSTKNISDINVQSGKMQNNNGYYPRNYECSQQTSALQVDNFSQRSFPQSSGYYSRDALDEPDGLMPPPQYLPDLSQMPPATGYSVNSNPKDSQKYSNLIDQSMNSANSSLIPSLIPLSNTKTQYMEDIFLSKRCRSEASSVSDYSDTFTDPSSLYEPSFRSNDSLFSDGGCSTSGYCTPVSVKDENAYKTPIGQKRSYSHLLPPPEPSPEGDFIGQHSQGIGGHYAESYRKRQRLDSSDFCLRF